MAVPLASAAALLVSASVSAQETPSAELTVAAESDTMVWNAVAVVEDRVFVAGPSWTGSKGPAVGIARGKTVSPYPDMAWNGWRPGADPARAFVNVNAIHLDPGGALWVVDTGAPDFGGDPLPGGAKLVKIDLATNEVVRIYPFTAEVAQPGSYVDDVRIHGRHAYLTDAGRPGLIVLDLDSGAARRVLDRHSSVTAPADRDIVLSGRVLRTADGKPLRVNSDPFELSPDGRWLYYAPLEGPWSRIETRYLDDASLGDAALAAHVEPWADLPPVGGTVMDADGSLYFSDLATDAIRRRAPDGTITTVMQDSRLHWVDAPFLDARHRLWLPVPQMDRSPNFSGADKPREWPVRLYRIDLPK
jgi:sugar lactone lactonase YvrE